MNVHSLDDQELVELYSQLHYEIIARGITVYLDPSEMTYITWDDGK